MTNPANKAEDFETKVLEALKQRALEGDAPAVRLLVELRHLKLPTATAREKRQASKPEIDVVSGEDWMKET